MSLTPSYSQWFARRAVPSIVGFIALGFVLMVVLLLQIAQQQNEKSAIRADSLVKTAISLRLGALERSSKDYANWGEAYRHLHPRIDLDWAYVNGNFGSSLFEEFAYEFLFVVGPDDRTQYSVVEGKKTDAPVARELQGDVADVIARARQAGGQSTVPVGAVLSANGVPVLVSAAVISTGDDPSVKPHPGQTSVLVFGDKLTAAKLDAISTQFLLPPLRTDAAPGDRRLVLSADGLVSGQILAWQPDRPGDAMLQRVVPWVAAALAALLLLTLAVLRNAWQMARINEQGARDLEAARSRAEHLSRHDTLTGLPNRAMLMEFLERSLAARRHDQTIALLYLDLDRFKPVNDALGHAAGDVVLTEISHRLRMSARESDLVARVGGDEFVIVCPGLPSPTDAEPLCRRFSEVAAATIRAKDGDVQVGLSIGVATAPGDARSPSELMRLADIAMYQAKGERRGSCQFYAAEMNERVTVRRALEIDLRRALAAEEFFLEFQPRFDTKTLAVTTVEALVRWRHPERGVVPPGSFIPIAEDTGLIVPLGEWVLNEACRLAAGWKNISVSVNLSAVQFRGGDIVENVSRALRQTGLPAERLELELTEGVLLEDTGRSLEVLNGLKSLGVKLAMDDFGTGYSSLGYLQAFPFDRLKIDRAFISKLTPNSEARSIVQAILGLGRALGMSVTAEGVETPEQLILLQADHCQEVQGFLFARPLATESVQEILDTCPEERRRTLAA